MKKTYKGKIYYTTKEEVEKQKRKGDRIYYVSRLGYYIIRPRNNIYDELRIMLAPIIILVIIGILCFLFMVIRSCI